VGDAHLDLSANVIANRLFESAKQFPNRSIVSDFGTRLTLEEFESLSSFFASKIREDALRHSGNSLVPLLVDRSVNSAIAIFAAIKSGIGFALIDAESSQEFVDAAFAKLGGHPSVVITHENQAVLFAARSTILVSSSDKLIHAHSSSQVNLSDPAVVLFTSGTSGEPKGVIYDWTTLHEVFRRNLSQLTDGDLSARCANFASFGFLAGLLRTLLIAEGVSVSIVDARTLNARDLLSLLKREQLTIISMTPSLAQTFTGIEDAKDLLPLVTQIYTYGESVVGRELSQIRRVINSGAKIVHRYDASEAPGGVYRYEIPSGAAIPPLLVPLGIAISPDRVTLAPVPEFDDGVREIVVRGLVAQGYLGEPELSAERFGIGDDGVPFWRSRDLVRLSPNGQLLHEGRIDNLVKINGRVVSTRFVETCLMAVPGVRHAAVIAEKKLSGRYFLLAHVEIDPNVEMSQDSVKAQLIEQELTWAIPQKIFRHNKLPLTNRGKVDFQKLRREEWPSWQTIRELGPNSALEIALKAKVLRILDLEEIDTDQDLWNVGLDSLGAIELSVVINRMGFLNVQPTDFAIHSTITAIATYLESIAVSGGETAFTFNADGENRPIFVLLPAGTSPLIFNGLAEVLGSSQPLVVMNSIDFSAKSLRLRTIERIASDRLARVREIQPEGPINLVGYCFGAILAYDMGQQDCANGGDARVTMLDSWFPALHLDDRESVHANESLIARQFKKSPRAIAESAYFRICAAYYVSSGKIPRNFFGAENFFPRLLSYSWVKIAAGYKPYPVSFPVAYIEGNDGKIMKDLEVLVPSEFLTVRAVDESHNDLLDPSALATIAQVVGSQADLKLPKI